MECVANLYLCAINKLIIWVLDKLWMEWI
uniref:Uncharacterized protein n=1 Tax=Arundo donax TaxID=35708 RepID=A0A0A9A8I3_ARUDO